MKKSEKFITNLNRRLGKLIYDGEITPETKQAVMASLSYYVGPTPNRSRL